MHIAIKIIKMSSMIPWTLKNIFEYKIIENTNTKNLDSVEGAL